MEIEDWPKKLDHSDSQRSIINFFYLAALCRTKDFKAVIWHPFISAMPMASQLVLILIFLERVSVLIFPSLKEIIVYRHILYLAVFFAMLYVTFWLSSKKNCFFSLKKWLLCIFKLDLQTVGRIALVTIPLTFSPVLSQS